VNLPNLISLMRLFMVPVIIWLIIDQQFGLAFILFVAAGISDLLDGLLARLLKSQTMVGKFLDPLADKVLLVGVFVTLGIQGFIPSWLVILVTFRDFLILGGALLALLYSSNLEIKPLFISKVNTVIQLIMIIFVLAKMVLNRPPTVYDQVLSIIVAATTLISGVAYVRKWLKNAGNTPC
jgi:Phosphatidylglycerophosphate synthase